MVVALALGMAISVFTVFWYGANVETTGTRAVASGVQGSIWFSDAIYRTNVRLSSGPILLASDGIDLREDSPVPIAHDRKFKADHNVLGQSMHAFHMDCFSKAGLYLFRNPENAESPGVGSGSFLLREGADMFLHSAKILPFGITILISIAFWLVGWGNAISLFHTLRDPIHQHLRSLGQPGSTDAETCRLYQHVFLAVVLLAFAVAAILMWVMVRVESWSHGGIHPLLAGFGSFWYLLVLLLALSWSVACRRIRKILTVDPFPHLGNRSVVRPHRLSPFLFLEIALVTVLCVQSFLYLQDSACREPSGWSRPISEIRWRTPSRTPAQQQRVPLHSGWSADKDETFVLRSKIPPFGRAAFETRRVSLENRTGVFLIRLALAALAFLGLSVWIHCECCFTSGGIICRSPDRRRRVPSARIWSYCHHWIRWIFTGHLLAVLISYVFICRSQRSFLALQKLSFSHYSIAFILTLGFTLLIVWTRLGAPSRRPL